MGQQSSNQIQDFVTNSVAKLFCNDSTTNQGVWDEINAMSYEEFVQKLEEFNKLTQKSLDSSGNALVFLVKKGTDKGIFWKATVQIACAKVDPVTAKVHSYNLFNLREFVQIFETLKAESAIAEESLQHDVLLAKLTGNHQNIEVGISSKESKAECCICFEREPDVILPCTHTYCAQCIQEWNENHDTCPICREHLETNDTWILTEVPRSEEICEDIRVNLMGLAQLT